MARVIADLIDGEARLSTAGDYARRLFQVSELAGSPASRLTAAARASGIPTIGAAHPHLANVRVSDVLARATNDPTVALVEVTYAIPSAAQSAISGAVEVSIVSDLYTEETITDINGKRIETRYFGVGASGGSFSATFTQQTHRIEVQRPTFTVQYSRAEASVPLSLARRYAGAVNAGWFLNEPADRWLCNVQSTQDSAHSHRVRYAFTLNIDGWQAEIRHQSNGIIPTNAARNNGIENVQVYRRADFNALRLPSL